MIPQEVQAWLHENEHGKPVRSQSVGGGCINQGHRIFTEGGQSFFLKTNPNTPPDMFACEAQGLAALDVHGGPRVPKTFLISNQFLLLEDLSPAPRQQDYWEVFGRQFATLHENTKDRFGFEGNNYIGSTQQINPWAEDGYDFLANHRLNFQAELAAKNGYLSTIEVQAAAQMAAKLKDLVPKQAASLLHGDLWSGNAITDSQGAPAIIDPAVYYGWAEADLAMTALFGGFPSSFYQSYVDLRPLESGWKARFPIYNLYHLLNHLNLFGRGYYGQVMQVVKRYSSV